MNQLSFEFSSRPKWADSIAVFDTETTGLDLREARIVTACVVELGADVLLVDSLLPDYGGNRFNIAPFAHQVRVDTTDEADAHHRQG